MKYLTAVLFSGLVLFGMAGCRTSRSVVVMSDADSVFIPAQEDYEGSKVEETATGLIKAVIDEARCWLGTPYLYAGHSRGGTDCSGMVMEVFRTAASLEIPRNSSAQKEVCREIEKAELRPGDLVFFATGRDPSRISHVGLYIGSGRMIHASSSRGVIVSDLEQDYYLKHYHSSGRLEALFATEKNEASQGTDAPQEADDDSDIMLPDFFD